MNKNKKAFTLVELIVVITILAILGTIAFISMQGYSQSSRDSVRISDVSSMKTALELFHLDAGKYPLPDNYEEITYGTDILWYQGTVGKTTVSQLSRSLNKIPTDPLNDKEYVFSVTGTKNEFEILNLLEGDLAYSPHTIFSQGEKGGYIFEQTNAANTTRTPRVDGQYNGLFVKTANYIFPTPSIINSEPIISGSGLVLDTTNIKSQVITGGKNIPVIGSVTPKTGELNIVLSVYSGTINKESTPEQKINAMKAIQGAYSGSELASVDVFKVILDKTTDADLIKMSETLILKNSLFKSDDNNLPLVSTFELSQFVVNKGVSISITNNCSIPPTGYLSSNTAVATISGTILSTIGLGESEISAIGGNCMDNSPKTITINIPSISYLYAQNNKSYIILNISNYIGYFINDYPGGPAMIVGISGSDVLVAASEDISGTKQWGCYGTNILGADSYTNGNQNTLDIVNGCSASDIAASICKNKGTLWYLPALDELTLIYNERLKLGNLNGTYYWSSTEDTSTSAKVKFFPDGVNPSGHKTLILANVRCTSSF